MRDAIRRYVDAAQSLTEIPRERAERIARRLAGNGMIDRDQIRSVASDIVSRSRENRRRLTDLVSGEVRRQASRIGFVSKEELDRLRQRVQALEANQQRAAKRTSTAKKKPARKPARKTAGKPASRR